MDPETTNKLECELCGCQLCHEYALKENVLYEKKHVFVMFNRYPYLPGHLMIVPKSPVPTINKMTTPEERLELINTISEVQSLLVDALGETFNVTSTNVGINSGPHSGASIPKHLHVHIVPRRANDVNFIFTCMFNGDNNPHMMFNEMYLDTRRWIIDKAIELQLIKK